MCLLIFFLLFVLLVQLLFAIARHLSFMHSRIVVVVVVFFVSNIEFLIVSVTKWIVNLNQMRAQQQKQNKQVFQNAHAHPKNKSISSKDMKFLLTYAFSSSSCLNRINYLMVLRFYSFCETRSEGKMICNWKFACIIYQHIISFSLCPFLSTRESKKGIHIFNLKFQSSHFCQKETFILTHVATEIGCMPHSSIFLSW